MPIVHKSKCMGGATRSKAATNTEERRDAFTVAALAGVDYRTALKALREGPGVLRALVQRERVARAIESLRELQSVGDATGSARGERIGD